MWPNFREEERGVALVEFALVAPLLLVLLFGMLDFGRTFNYWIDATHLANEGARWAVVNKNPASSGTLQAYIQQQADTNELRNGGSTSVPGGLEVCISFPSGTSTVGSPVKVTASVDYNWMPFLSDHALGIEPVDRRTEHNFDEAVDMAAGAIHIEWHLAALFEPTPEHDIVLSLVGAMLFDECDELSIMRVAGANGVQHAVKRRVAAMLIVDVDRSQ